MTGTYFRRLLDVEQELEAARESINYVLLRWEADTLTAQLPVKRKAVAQTLQNLETTYFLRLFAEFEGILKDHLRTNHAAVPIPPKPKVDQLIFLTLKAEGVTLDPVLRRKINAVRDYRNALAHTDFLSISRVSFSNARSYLNTFVAKLPAPQ